MSLTGPLFDVRGTIETLLDSEINADSPVCTLYQEWRAPTGAAIILDGGGWTQRTGCGLHYTVRVNCVVGNQSGLARYHAEELARRAYSVLRNAGYEIDPVPPPGLLRFGDRDYPAVTITTRLQLDPEEEEE